MASFEQGLDDTAKEEVRSRIDIAVVVGRYVTLKGSPHSLKGLCPFHKEKTPSFTVNAERGLYHCFGCGKGGDVFDFVMEREGLTFPEALRKLADEAGVALKPAGSGDRTVRSGTDRRELLKIHEVATQFYYECMKKSDVAIAYFKARKLSAVTVREFRLGYAPDDWSGFSRFAAQKGIAGNALSASGLVTAKGGAGRAYDRFRNRIMFPLFDITGRPVAFAGRGLSDDVVPKYLNSPETPLYRKSNILYGLHAARDAIKEVDQAFVVEGYMDFLALYEAGIRNVVATSGTALTPEHGRILHRFTPRVVLVFDGDDAGVAAASRAAFVLAPLHLDLKVLLLPTGEDPDSFVRSRGAEAFREMAGQARDALDFVLDKAVAELRGDTARGKSAVLNHIKPLVSSMPDDILRGDFIRRTAEKLGIDERLARTRLRRDRPSSASSETRPGDFSAEYLGTREGNFIRVVLQNPSLIPRAREVITPEALTDRFSVDLYSIVLEEHDSRGTPVHLMDRVEDPEMRRVISRIMMVPPPPEESAEDELAHTMKYLMVKHLRARLSALRPRLKGRPELLSEQKRLSSLVQRIMSGEDIYRLCQNG